MRVRGVQGEAAGAGARLKDTDWRHRAGGAVDIEDVNAATVAGRQIDLGRQNIVQRRTEGADVGDERFGSFSRWCCKSCRQQCRCREREGYI